MSERIVADGIAARHVWVVEDERPAADLAVELCESSGATTSLFMAPLPFLAALRDGQPPMAVVLDWRLEHQLSAGLFLATRHRHPSLPIICWTGSAASSLPAMIRDDPLVVIVDKAGGTEPFERALGWALAAHGEGRSA